MRPLRSVIQFVGGFDAGVNSQVPSLAHGGDCNGRGVQHCGAHRSAR